MAPQPLPEIEHVEGQNYLFCWEGVPGRVYFIQTSSRPPSAVGFSWDFAPDIRVGNGERIEMGFAATAANAEFFRLVYTDYSGTVDPNLADFDHDGYTNLEEAIENTDPFDAQAFPSSGTVGTNGGGNGIEGGNGSAGGTNWTHPWEYQLTYAIGEYSTVDKVNPFFPLKTYNYSLENGIVTTLDFADLVGENEANFLQLEPNLDYDPDDPNSNEWKVIGVVELSAQNPNWTTTGTEEGGEYLSLPKGLLLPVDLAIHNGQGAAQPVPDNEEETVGAFTVANLNDTDGDGTVDNGDNTVKKGAAGEDEEDLMKLIVKGPDLGRMKVTVVSGNVEFWEKSTKETKIAKQGNAVFIDGADLPKTLWVEATNHSNALRDIELKLGFEAPGGQLTDDLDKVKATAVWAEKISTKKNNGDALWGDADDATFKNTFNNIVGDFGINFSAPSGNFHYTIGFEFTVKPSGVGTEPGVKFDITRQIEKKYWARNGAAVWQKVILPWEVFDAADESNDDRNNGDEDVVPKNDHIYVIDGPGLRNNGAIGEFVAKLNFNEFVRVSFDGVRPVGENSDGSRASLKIPWHAHYWLEGNGTTYARKAGKRNSVDEGHQPLGGDANP